MSMENGLWNRPVRRYLINVYNEALDLLEKAATLLGDAGEGKQANEVQNLYCSLYHGELEPLSLAEQYEDRMRHD